MQQPSGRIQSQLSDSGSHWANRRKTRRNADESAARGGGEGSGSLPVEWYDTGVAPSSMRRNDNNQVNSRDSSNKWKRTEGLVPAAI